MIDVDIAGKRGDFDYAVTFKNKNRVTALFGASGAGKTTIIDALAGSLTPANGHIKIGENTFFDTVNSKNMTARKRQVGQIYQDATLFPHLNVKSNLTYARWAGWRKKKLEFDEVVELLGLGDFLQRMPDSLSGGERQRVAIGRALLADPKLLLFDEPLSALDHKRKSEIMPYFERIARESDIPMVYVTHDPDEVIRLADHLVLVDHGRVQHEGPLSEVLPLMNGKFDGVEHSPISLISASYESVEEEHGITELKLEKQSVFLNGIVPHREEPYRVRIDAKDVGLALELPKWTSFQNVLQGRVFDVEVSGNTVDIIISIEGQKIVSRITSRAQAHLDLKAGQIVYALVKSIAIEKA